jgi:acyl carrier protein
MDRAALKTEIKGLLIETLDLRGRRAEDIADEAPLFGDGLGLDSLDALQLAMAIEERFGVAVPEGDAGKRAFASVDAIAELIASARGS